jgi:murein DD-endopeptidase MepM/ murein hydrolase activator NlpD
MMNKTLLAISLSLTSLFFLTACTIQNSNQLPVGSSQSSVNSDQESDNLNKINSEPVVNENVNAKAVVNTNTIISEFVPPLDRPAERLTKKPFGIYITPKTSPVQPERFSGYHTGADFETFSDEAETAVEVRAFCSGEIVYKQRVSGYGGVLIQKCAVDDQAVTVLYGHLALGSSGVKIGDSLAAGETIGQLGQGGSSDTDGERKHLHFGIHKGSAINVKGYVSKQSDLSGWLDPEKFII